MSSTSCHTIRASSSTARILSFRPLRTPNRKKHRRARSTHRAPIRWRCCARYAGRSPRANTTATRAQEARAPGSHRRNLRRRELQLGSRRAHHAPRGVPTRRLVLSAGFRTWVGPIVRSPAPQVPIVLIATPSNPYHLRPASFASSSRRDRLAGGVTRALAWLAGHAAQAARPGRRVCLDCRRDGDRALAALTSGADARHDRRYPDRSGSTPFAPRARVPEAWT